MDLDTSDGRSSEALKKMRSLDPNVPIFVSSIHPASGKAPFLASIGVTAVFKKPIDIGILRLWLERTLKGERADSVTTG